jgi:hypothetical protein
MAYQITEKLISYNRSNQPLNPTILVIHSTADNGATAQNEFNWFNTGNRNASAHYFVDDTSIIRTVPETEIAWHALYTANHSGIGVECCEFTEMTKFTEVWNRALWLASDICTRWKIPVEKVYSHHEVTIMYPQDHGTHTDPDEYFQAHGKSMDQFRHELAILLNGVKGVVMDDIGQVVGIDPASTLNIRAGLGTTFPVRYQLKLNDQIHLIEKDTVDGVDWYKTTYGPEGGYVSGKYIKVLPKPMQYRVYQFEKLLQEFVTQTDAITEAKKWDHSSVRQISDGTWIWDNYPTPAPTDIYTVVAGDTLYSVSMKTKLAISDIKAFSGLTSDALFVGQTLRLNKPPVLDVDTANAGLLVLQKAYGLSTDADAQSKLHDAANVLRFLSGQPLQ